MSEMSNLLGLKPPADIKLGTNTPRAMAKAPKVVLSIDEIDKTAWPREGSGARAAFEFLVQNPGADAVALAEIMNCPKNNVAGGMGFYVQRGLIEVRKDKSRGTWPVSLYYLAGTAPAEENAGTEGPAASASAPSSPVEAVAATPPESNPASQPSEVGSGGATLPAAPPQRDRGRPWPLKPRRSLLQIRRKAISTAGNSFSGSTMKAAWRLPLPLNARFHSAQLMPLPCSPSSTRPGRCSNQLSAVNNERAA